MIKPYSVSTQRHRATGLAPWTHVCNELVSNEQGKAGHGPSQYADGAADGAANGVQPKNVEMTKANQ